MSWLYSNFSEIWSQLSIIVRNYIREIASYFTGVDIPKVERKNLDIKQPKVEKTNSNIINQSNNTNINNQSNNSNINKYDTKFDINHSKDTKFDNRLKELNNYNQDNRYKLNSVKPIYRGDEYPWYHYKNPYSAIYYILGFVIIIVGADMLFYYQDDIWDWFSNRKPSNSDSPNDLNPNTKDLISPSEGVSPKVSNIESPSSN